MLHPESATASVEEMFLKDLPEGVTLLPRNFKGKTTTRVMVKFYVSQQAINNKNFDLNGFIKTKFNNALTVFRHKKNVKELRLTRRLQMVIDPNVRSDRTRIHFLIEYADDKEQ